MNPDQPPDSSSMSLATSPTHDVAKLMGRRSLSNIPKDQRSLLELENSWAVDQRDGPHGLATVPSHVLKTLKEAFIRLKDDNEKNLKDKENPDPPPTTNDRDGQNGYSPGSSPARSDSAPPSSPGVPIPWSQSPAKSRAQQDDEMSEAGSPIDETPSSPAPAPLTQPPLFHGTPSPSPPSSASEPEDLEMELPQAQGNREAPMNREAPINREAPVNHVAIQMHLTAASQEPTSLVTSMVTTTDTPPCAQPLVASAACTSSEDPKSSVLPVDPTHGRSRRMKPIEFSEDSPKVTVHSTNPGPPTRMPSMRAFPEENVPNSASLSSSNSAPYHDGRPQSSPSPPPPPPPPHNFTLKHATPQNRTTGQLDDVNSRDISPHRQTPVYQLYRIQALGMNAFISDRAEPYGAFTATYPDYITVHSGNLLSFIQACVYLEIIREERAIREYLYDDFIRAWSSGFLIYAQNAGPGQEPLPAVQWFNMLKGPILFNRMCVNSGNLGVVLNAYPEEAARVRAILDASKETSESPASEPQPEQEVEMELEEEPDQEPEREPERRRERKRRVVDLLDSDNAMDITVTEETRAEPQLPPPTRKPPSLPPPSRAAPPPPPRPLSPELGSDDFDYPPLSLKTQLAPRQQSRSRSRPHTHEPQPQSRSRPEPRPEPQPQPQPQPQLQPHRELTLPQRHSPRRHPAPVPIPPIPAPSSTAPASSTTRRPPKSSNPKSSPRSTDHAGKLVSRGRSVPSSGSRAIPKLRKRSTEERARLKEHFRKKASSSSTSFLGSGVEN